MIRGIAHMFGELLSGSNIVQFERQTTQNNFSRETKQHIAIYVCKKHVLNCDYYRIVK